MADSSSSATRHAADIVGGHLGGRPPPKRSDFGLFRDFEGVVNLDAQVSHR
jgi:hypothetical protein